MTALHQPRFVIYLVAVCLTLAALAMAGPGWFVAGLCCFAALEVMTTLRRSDARRQVAVALSRHPQR